MSQKKGRIVAVNGNMITVEFDTSVIQNEVAYAVLGDKKLKAEVIRVEEIVPTYRCSKIHAD